MGRLYLWRLGCLNGIAQSVLHRTSALASSIPAEARVYARVLTLLCMPYFKRAANGARCWLHQ